MTHLSAEDIARLSIHGPKGFASQLQSTEHRIAIVSNWAIPIGSKVLELGCGQGDCTAVLAELVGEKGHVTAVDPGALDYGGPFTLGQAQSYLSQGRLGERITWKQADPLEFLKSDTTEYDVAVLAICTWYFSSPSVLAATLSALFKRVCRVCIAEWSLSSAHATAQPHILAALTQAALERYNPASTANIRTALSPSAIKEAAAAVAWILESEANVVPEEHVLDGRWEVQRVMGKNFTADLQEFVKDEKDRSVIIALRDATLASVERVGGVKKVTSMDVWSGVFTSS